MGFLTKMFSYSIMELRLSDKDKEIDRLVQENMELRDRLYVKHGLPRAQQASAVVETEPADPITGWIPPKKRLANYIDSLTPLTAKLSDDEMKFLRGKVQ